MNPLQFRSIPEMDNPESVSRNASGTNKNGYFPDLVVLQKVDVFNRYLNVLIK